ncbi:MAG: hypothetical protein LUH46_00585 [Alistipes sp.]|nr:hypothetical protein [Alistipes sp.]
MNTLFHFVVFVLIDCLSGTKVRIYLQQTIPRRIFLETFCRRSENSLPQRAARTEKKTIRTKVLNDPERNFQEIFHPRIGVSASSTVLYYDKLPRRIRAGKTKTKHLKT